MPLSARRAAKCRGTEDAAASPVPLRRIAASSAPPIHACKMKAVVTWTCFQIASIKSCWRNPECRQGFPPPPSPWIPGFRPPEAQKAAGYASPGRVPLPGRVHPAAFRLPPKSRWARSSRQISSARACASSGFSFASCAISFRRPSIRKAFMESVCDSLFSCSHSQISRSVLRDRSKRSRNVFSLFLMLHHSSLRFRLFSASSS